MRRDRVYLDWNATAPLRDAAKAAMVEAMEIVGNPSSVHGEGRAAKALLERSRGEIATAVGCKPAEVVFTSGATEAAGVLDHLAGPVKVDETAHDALFSKARDGDGAGVWAQGLANSETGVITELESTLTGLTCLDVTQAIGRIPYSFAWDRADLAVLSAHKLGGPRGIGALIVREGIDIGSLSTGGGQEMGRRSGTENLIGAAGFAAAITAAMRDLETGAWKKVAELRNILESTLAAGEKDTIFVGQGGPRLANTTCFATPGWKGETQVMALDLAGFAISAGSACSSGKVRESRVLRAMGFDEDVARSAVRVSLGPTTSEAEVMAFAECWLHQRQKHRARAA